MAVILFALPCLVHASAKSVVTTERVRAELVAHAEEGIKPGKPVWLGLAIRHQPHWHTYWLNPGDSGLATTLSWKLREGVSAGPIQWPTPQAIPFGPLTNYGYEGDLLLPVSLTVPADFNAATLDVELRADWLVCAEICIPETGTFFLQVPTATPSIEHAALFAHAQALIPADLTSVHATTRVEGQFLDIKLDSLPAELRGRSLRLFPEIEGVTDASSPIEQQWIGDRWAARVPLSPQRSGSPTDMHVVLTYADSPQGARVYLANIGPWPGQSGSTVTAPSPTSDLPPTLAVSLALAFLGGVLLNLMPCVFPILTLKMLSFAQPGQDRSALTAGGLAYTAGVVASFLMLAGLLLALRAGGEQLGWGFQLQSPVFVAFLAAVFTLIGLNLAGVFEFAPILPSGLAGLQSRHPIADHALTGVLAVAVASPCTAPFMGAALGAALVMPAFHALLVFAALGLGMAMPYLLASLFPAVVRWIPRPGAWMVRFKILMAFPMFATVVWLLWVIGQQTGIDGAIGVLAILLALAFVAWALGSPGFGHKARWGFGTVAVIVLVVTVAWAWPLPTISTAKVASSTDAVWAPWSPDSVVQAQADGRPVFVDFTAVWCITCQWNKRSTLSDPTVLAGFERHRVRLLRADWTRRDPRITEELARLGRNGVPVYALYLPGATTPRLLPEILRADEIHRVLAELPPTDG